MDLRNKTITVGELLDDPRSKAVFQRRFGKLLRHPMAGAARVLSGPLPNLLGGLVLAGIGAWFVLDWLRRLGPAGEAEGENRAATLWGCVSLAAALAVNNAGIGVAAGVSGIAPGWAALANFLVTLAALPLGRALGDKLAGRLLGKYALPLSGALLVLLGIWEAVG